MAWKFPASKACYTTDTTFLDGATSLSWFCRGRFDAINVGDKQYWWGLYDAGSPSRCHFRKNNGTPEYFRWSITTADGSVTVDDIAPSVDTIYSVAGTWQTDNATGLKVYVNAGTASTASTASKTSSFNTSGLVPRFYFACLKESSDFATCSLEMFAMWKNVVLTSTQVTALHNGEWPHIAVPTVPAIQFEFYKDDITRLQDLSGNGHHITNIDVGVTGIAPLGMIQMPIWDDETFHTAGASGGASPNPWSLWSTVNHPIVSSRLTGLSNGTTYELSLTALDDVGNESARSALSEATPAAPSIAATKKIPWLSADRRSKYRSTQQ